MLFSRRSFMSYNFTEISRCVEKTVGGDSHRRFYVERQAIGDGSRLLQTRSGNFIRYLRRLRRILVNANAPTPAANSSNMDGSGTGEEEIYGAAPAALPKPAYLAPSPSSTVEKTNPLLSAAPLTQAL